jgi:hypothetical protein
MQKSQSSRVFGVFAVVEGVDVFEVAIQREEEFWG